MTFYFFTVNLKYVYGIFIGVNLMKIAICDDESKIRKETKDALNNYFSEKLIEFEIYDFSNGEDLLNSKIDFDMAFLDIERRSS